MNNTTTNLPKCWQDAQDVLNAGVDRLILFGPPGVGKTFAGLNYGNVSPGAWRVNCTEDMTTADVTGHWLPAGDSEWVWRDGGATQALRNGGRLVLDEVDKASGDVLATLLAVTDTPESIHLEHPGLNGNIKPTTGYSVVCTTNCEDMRDLPEALVDRFPVRIRINEPHPDALLTLSHDLRDYARRAADLGERRISLRQFQSFDKLRKGLGDQARAASIVFGDKLAQAVLDAIAIDKVLK
jgi:MoxR-like ATPase